MKSVKLIQLGDIHFPDIEGEAIGDIKDRAVAGALINAVTPNKLTVVMRSILETCENESVAGILISGDLTSQGNLKKYTECVRYLNTCLELTNLDKWREDDIHAVPGNHDVNRAHCDPAGVDLLAKFVPLLVPWKDIGLPVLTVDNVRATAIPLDDCGVKVFSLNSCMGCGEQRHLPESVRGQLKKVLDDYAGRAAPADAFDLVGEQLDTPAFEHTHVDSLVQGIIQLDSHSIPVVLAHHNVLPQATPRIAMYTELINGGFLRSRLTSCERPVIYCHGHIHDDPIEIVADQRRAAGNLLIISAPELVRGFNLIEIQFSRGDLPIGCRVVNYRLQNHGGVEPIQTVRIPLTNRTETHLFVDQKLRDVVEATGSTPQRFEEFRSTINADRKPKLQRPTIRDTLIEAEWLSLVAIANRNYDLEHWQISRIEL